MIGYYAHHHGSGHLARAEIIARRLSTPVTLLSTAAPADAGAFAGYVPLASDAANTRDARDPTAAGQLHWVPMYDEGLQNRMARIAGWIRDCRPAAMVVDVSVEVANLVRLLGVPVIVIAMPGHRIDAAHRWGYGLAERIIAPWPREVYDPPWLHELANRTHYVGAFSRFDDLDAPPARAPFRTGAVLCGAGGSSLTSDCLATLAVDHPEVEWRLVGGPGTWRNDVWSVLANSDVVVSHGGQNAVAEIAAARRPAVLIPEPRPYGEQEQTCAALSAAGIARCAAGWSAVSAELRKPVLDPAGWSRWSVVGAAGAAAGVIGQVAADGCLDE